MFKVRVSNSKWNVMAYKVELVTREKNFSKNVRVSNSKWDVILCNFYNSRMPNLDKHFHYVCLVFLLAFLNFFSLYT